MARRRVGVLHHSILLLRFLPGGWVVHKPSLQGKGQASGQSSLCAGARAHIETCRSAGYGTTLLAPDRLMRAYCFGGCCCCAIVQPCNGQAQRAISGDETFGVDRLGVLFFESKLTWSLPDTRPWSADVFRHEASNPLVAVRWHAKPRMNFFHAWALRRRITLAFIYIIYIYIHTYIHMHVHAVV